MKFLETIKGLFSLPEKAKPKTKRRPVKKTPKKSKKPESKLKSRTKKSRPKPKTAKSKPKKKALRKPATKAKPKRKTLKKETVKKVQVSKSFGKEVGIVTHYFGRISVGIIKLRAGIKTGDRIHFKGAHDDFSQTVKSMQVNHKAVVSASRGDEVGIEVNKKVHENDRVYLLS
ncbi:MAG: hypothetical protein JW867_00195 [Candidatus Omnitrophica bacterium]|nr:hypothetical protein [Candidatus Omnitrophota bacterium]